MQRLDADSARLRPYQEDADRRRANFKMPELLDREPDARDVPDLTDAQRRTLEVARYCVRMLEQGVRARKPFETWDEAWDAYNGNLWPARYPVWKARVTINKIKPFVHFLQAVMTDQKPRISVEPQVPGTEDAAGILTKIVDRDWDECEVQDKSSLAVLYGIIWGTGIMKAVHNPAANNGKGKREVFAVPPYRIFTNRTATCVEDAEYIIHLEDQTLGWVKRNYPDDYDRVSEFVGARIGARATETRDFVRAGPNAPPSGIATAVRTVQQSGLVSPTVGVVEERNAQHGAEDDTIQVGEFWFRDDERETFERQTIVDGVPQMEPETDEHGLPVLEPAGEQVAMSPIDGMPFMQRTYRLRMKPKMETASRLKYPNGRLVIMAGPIVLRDIPNPYQIDGFPFASWKCYDIGAFFGIGEVLGMKDPQVALMRIASQIFDIFEKTGNPIWLYKRGSGMNEATWRGKPGSIVKLDELDALKPLETKGLQPGHLEFMTMLKGIMPEIAGLQDTMMGASPGANTAFATVDQLQESGAAPVRQKVRNMERMIRRVGRIMVQLSQQFDRGDRPLRERVEQPRASVVDPDTGETAPVVAPAAEDELTFRMYSAAEIQGDVNFAIVPDSSLSTSPAGIWTRYMQMHDKGLIDNQAFHEKFRIDGYRKILARMAAAQAAAAAAKAAGGGKPGPKPSGNRRSPPKPAPPMRGTSRVALNAVR